MTKRVEENLVQEIDDALRAGGQAYRIGGYNIRPVRCGVCAIDCLPGQARRIHLAVRLWRSVFLCKAHLPRREL